MIESENLEISKCIVYSKCNPFFLQDDNTLGTGKGGETGFKVLGWSVSLGWGRAFLLS